VALNSSNDLFVGDAVGNLHAIRGSSERWSKLLQPTFGPILPLRQPAIAIDGTIYINVGPGEVFALNDAGDKLWSTQTGTGLNLAPVLSEDGTIYVPNPASLNFVLAALRSNGSSLWSSIGLDGKVLAPPVIAADRSIYVPTTPGQFQALSGLVALHADGSTNWTFNISSEISPAIATDGTIFVAGTPFTRSQFGSQFSANKVICALHRDGTIKWSYTNDMAVTQGLAIGKAGAIYATQINGVLLAISGSSAIADTSWPLFGRDPRHTFQQRAPVTLEILTPDQISDTSARFSANLNPAGTASTLFFQYSDGSASTDSAATAVPATNELLHFTQAVSGLTPGTIYTVHAVSSNNFGVIVSADLSFKTSGGAAEVPAVLQSLQAVATLGGSIKFSGDGTIEIGSPIEFTKNAEIDGNGHSVILSGLNNSLLRLGPGIQLTLRHLSLINGKAVGVTLGETQPARGGAIASSGGNLTLSECTLSNNVAQGVAGSSTIAANASGAVLWQSGGTLLIDKCHFLNNKAVGGSGFAGSDLGEAKGGAIYLKDAQVTISQSDFQSNSAVAGSGSFPYKSGPAAGGVFYAENSTLEIFDSTFASNQTFGGATDAETHGGAICFVSGNLSVSNCVLTLNSVSGGAFGDRISTQGAPAYGGALFNSGSTTVVNSSFLTNSTHGGLSRYAEGGQSAGGAIYSTAPMGIINTTLAGNVADTHSVSVIDQTIGTSRGVASAIFGTSTIGVTNATIAWNSGSQFAISSTSSNVILKNSLLVSNASQNASINIVDGGNNISNDATPELTQTTSQNNVDPRLGPIGYYGGSTPVYPLVAGSPAMDYADDLAAPPTDQRARTRPYGAHADIGAFESSPPYYVWGQIGGYHDPSTILSLSLSNRVVNADATGSFNLGPLPPGPVQIALDGTNAAFKPNPWGITVNGDASLTGVTSFELHSLTFDGTSEAPAFTLAGLAGETYRVDSSLDLKTWNTVSTYTIDASGLVTIPVTNAAALFLRATQQ